MSEMFNTGLKARGRMLPMVDLDAARDFMAQHPRLLDRRRFGVVVDGDPPEGALAALSGYRNADGGYGWGLEPDLRSTTSQTGPALHAFEVFEDILPATSDAAVELCDWLASVSLPDGGIPFALGMEDPAGTAPFWAEADPTESSLQITAIVAVGAQRVASQDPAVAAHPWLSRATEFCLEAIEALDEAPFALQLAFAVRLLDAIHDREPRAKDLLAKLAGFIPPDGLVPVAGGSEGETMRPLDFAAWPGTAARELFTSEVISADLERLADGQQDDGGWTVDYASYSPVAALEWRGHATVRAVTILKANGML